jgi:secondary thiamine-phosphate synthase enzyme
VATVIVNGRQKANVREGLACVATGTIEFPTRGDADVVRITDEVREALAQTGLRDGTVTVFAPGATGAVTTIEYEPGVVHDLQQVLDEIVPPQRRWQHNVNNGDGNGHSHVRAGILGPSLTIPFVDGRLTLGRWQEVVFIDLDERPRDRRLIVQAMGV